MSNKEELEIVKSNYNGDKYLPKGYVFCYDENGKLLFHTHNMIVKTGRELIFKSFLGNTADALNFSDLSAKVGDSTEIVSAEDTKDSLGTESPTTIKSRTADNTKLVYTFTISYDSANNPNGISNISTLGLFKGDTLFSRVVFPKYSATSTLTFTYYLYF